VIFFTLNRKLLGIKQINYHILLYLYFSHLDSVNIVAKNNRNYVDGVTGSIRFSPQPQAHR
jgi:hypothetical protein